MTPAPSWTPRTPPVKLTSRPVRSSPAWKAYLTRQGYTPRELPRILEGQDGRKDAPGLVDAAELRVAQLERASVENTGAELEGAGLVDARAGAVRVYLEDHPPIRTLALDPRPVDALSAVTFGTRLVEITPGVLEDLITGRRWNPVGETGTNAGLSVVAGALFRLVGLAAPAARLVELEGVRRALHPKPEAWDPMAWAVLELHRDKLWAELPADAWLGYLGGLAGLRGRSHPMPAAMASTLRLALGSTLGRAAGRKAPTWGVDVPELGKLLGSKTRAGGKFQDLAPMAKRLAGVTDAQIRRAVALGEFPEQDATRLSAVLMGRRDLVASATLDLIAGASPSG